MDNGSGNTRQFEVIDSHREIKEILTSVYEIFAVMLETMTFKNFGHTFLVILGNIIISVFVILFIEFIFHPRVKNEA